MRASTSWITRLQTLIANGGGQDPNFRVGLFGSCSRVGSARDIDVVINTHLHSDHCGWNTRELDEGQLVPTFPNARYLIQQGEWRAATQPNERTRATYLQENLLPLKESGRLEL
ncbi:MAG: MBL fold metallo-hydrolase, partial [Gemmatimonadetes bacterium]|nr:MBL fold metallo-hydrolase [Gemmatimonadota bacterium]